MKSKSLSDNPFLLKGGLSALLILMLVSLWLPAPWLWGINHAIWLPRLLGLGFPLVGLLLVWTPAGAAFGGGLTGSAAVWLWNRPLLVYGLVPVLGGAAFWFRRETTHMLGDGQTLAVKLADGHLHHGFDFMTYHLLARAYQVTGSGGEEAAFLITAVLGCFSGAAYLAAAAWSARRLTADPADGILLYLLLILSAPLLLFFGYMEVYAPETVAMLVFMTLLCLYREGRTKLLNVAAVWAIGLFFHLNALFLAPLLAAAVVFRGRGDTSSWQERLLKVTWPPVAAVLLAGAILAAGGHGPTGFLADFGHVGRGGGILVGLTGQDGFLTWRHLKDIVNLLILLAPVPLVMLIVGIRKGNRPLPPTLAHLVTGSAGLIVLMSLVHMKLGAVRDWDLFAPHASLLILTGWYAATGGPRGASPAAVGRLVGVALVLTIPWLTVNLEPARSLSRLEETAADLSPYALGLLHEQFAYHYQMTGDQEEVTRHYRRCGEVCPNHPRFHAIYGTYQLNQGNLTEAVAAYQRSVAADSTYVYGWKMEVLARVMNADYAGALAPARHLARLGGQDAQAAAAHGMAAQRMGLLDEALTAYLAGYALDGSRLDLLERAAGLQLVQRQYTEAANNFRTVLNSEAAPPSAALGLADAIWQGYQANRQNLTSAAGRARLDEVIGLIGRVQAAPAAQGISAADLAAWKQEVQEARAGLQ